MKRLYTKRLVVALCAIFLGSLLLSSCAASSPGFNSTGKKGQKVKSSGRMYNK